MTTNYEKTLANGALVKIVFDENKLYVEPDAYINDKQFGCWDFIELRNIFNFLEITDNITLKEVLFTINDVEELYKFITSCEDQYDKEVSENEEGTED